MSDSRQNHLSFLVVSCCALACAEASNFDGAADGSGGASGFGNMAGTAGRTGGTGGRSTGGFAGIVGGAAGAAGSAGNGGTGLTSDVFGGGSSGGGGGGAVACDYPSPRTCDFSRMEGCCKPLACERANGSDVFNMYPVESCQSLVECVRANPGCSNASDPLCFQNEIPGAPCLMQGYQASHSDPEGPFAWTAKLVSCVCGY